MAQDETILGEAPQSVPVAPSLGPALATVNAAPADTRISRRVLFISALAIGIAVVAAFVAELLVRLIGLITNIAFFGKFAVPDSIPSAVGNHLGLWVVGVPVVGGVIVGFMARYGSSAIRGHGIPEAMEQVLYNQSRIPGRITFLKPASAAIAIGTGGPFGAEGPIIATGGAIGSFVGQLIKVSADERKTLLAAGAAAGMSATFLSPVSSVLLAIELLLFEYRVGSLVPVALAAAVACGARMVITGSSDPSFPMPQIDGSSGEALATYIVIGAIVGLVSVGVTRAVYAVEDAFEHALPIDTMWWPAFGGVAVGVCGYFVPRTMGVGYSNITGILSGSITGKAMVVLVVVKFVSWAISLGSGTSGGTLAPLFTLGGGVGAGLGLVATWILPSYYGVDPRVAALVGMAAMFAGASRALLTSVVFAFETTRQPMGLLPLLGGCTAAYLISALLMKHTIMTEKIARRGARVVTDYTADYLARVVVRDVGLKDIVSLDADRTVVSVREWLATRVVGTSHQGFPVVDKDGLLVGVVTRRDLFDDIAPDARIRDVVKRPPAVVYGDSSLREVADFMITEGVGRVPVVTRDAPRVPVGILTRSDLLSAHGRRLEDARRTKPDIDVRRAIARGARAVRR
jgi:chloride channel protein, CIC family